MRALLLALLALSAPAAPLRGQSPHAGARGHVWESHVARAAEDRLALANGALIEPATPVGLVAPGAAAVLVPLRSGCRIWIEGAGMHRCRVLAAPPEDAPRTAALLVWMERIADAGTLVLLSGGSALDVARGAAAARAWRPGEALLIDDARLLPLAGTDELAEVRRHD